MKGGGGGDEREGVRLIGLAGISSDSGNWWVQLRRGVRVRAADEQVGRRNCARRYAFGGGCGLDSLRGGSCAALRQLLDLAFKIGKLVVDVAHENLEFSRNQRGATFEREWREGEGEGEGEGSCITRGADAWKVEEGRGEG